MQNEGDTFIVRQFLRNRWVKAGAFRHVFLLGKNIWLLYMITMFTISAIASLFLAYSAQAISIGAGHSQGATITKDYFIYTVVNDVGGGQRADVFRCNRNGLDINESSCKKIASGIPGHANVIEHKWGSNYFSVEVSSESNRCYCYTLDGNKVDSSFCGKLNHWGWSSDAGGLTHQGRAEFGDYRLKAFGQTSDMHSRIVVKKKKGDGYEAIKVIDLNEKPVAGVEIEDVAVDGNTGEIYYTMSGDYNGPNTPGVTLHKVSDYTLPIMSSSENSANQLSDQFASIFAQNNLNGWNPFECESKKGSSGLCGDTAREIYWSALSQYFDDPIKIAGIVGNLANEGGMNPVAWEGSITNSDGSLTYDWDYIYGGGLDGAKGVGAFGITSGLSVYLHAVAEKAPELLHYFQNGPEYNFNYIHPGSGVDESHPSYGDVLLEKIGADEFGKLVEFEIRYAIEDFNPSRTQGYMEASFSSPSDASFWWMDKWEIPAYRNSDDRARDAEKAYDEFNGKTCTPKSSEKTNEESDTTNTEASDGDGSKPNPTTKLITSADITLIGDVVSVRSAKQLRETFPNSFLNMVKGRSYTSGSGKCSDGGGMKALSKILSNSGTLYTQNGTSDNCIRQEIDGQSMKDNVVLQLGINTSGATMSNIVSIIKSLGEKRKVFLVTPYASDSKAHEAATEKVARTYHNLVRKYNNVYLINWAENVKTDPEKYLEEDGYSPTKLGSELLAKLLRSAIENSNIDYTATSPTSNSTPSSDSSLPSNSGPNTFTPGSSSGTITGSDITWIGDSYSVQADNNGLISGSELFDGVDIGPSPNNVPTSYIQGSKFVSKGDASNPSCLSILEDVINSGKLRPILVFACGTNGGWSESDILKFQSLLEGRDTQAIVVTSKIPSNDYADSNARLKEMADNNNNIFMADWTTVYDESYFSGDRERIHPVTDPGYEKWIGVIADALNSVSGCTTFEGDYPQYYQQTGYTCGPTSMAMLATVASGQDVSEADVINVIGSDTAYVNTVGSGMVSLDQKVGEKYGFTVEKVDVNGLDFKGIAAKMKEYLDKGYMIHMSGCGNIISSTGGCHYTGMFKINGDDVLLADSSSLSNREVNLVDYISSGYHGDAFSAIKKEANTSNKCKSDACGNEIDTNYNGDGLTDEQAQKLADNYNNNAENWDTMAGRGLFCEGSCASKYSNCSLMSAFFVEMFTSVGTGVGWTGMYGGNVTNVLSGMDFEVGSEPKAFSIFSCGATNWGHTGVVVRVDGDELTTVEAGYPNQIGQVVHSIGYSSWCSSSNLTYAYLNDKMDFKRLMEFIGK